MKSNPNVIRPGVKTPVSNKDLTSKILRNVKEQEGFHFYIAIGEPTGITAVSLADFAEKMADLDVRSVNFHYPRRDFEKWILEVIGDSKLASSINMISRMHIGIKGEALRNQIIRVVKVRLSEINPPPPATSKPPVFGATSGTDRTRQLF
ncbi:hypothetical protein JW988_01585 [Candidatus Bathyarchaeota archaeon]|nr:hypothetical protein [Candidatus Bathyarchaeota archaeon]